MKAENQELNLLNDWLGRLEQEVAGLAVDERIFWRIQKIIEENTALQIPSEFYGWMGRLYVAYVAMAIRRQVDDDSRTDSFVRFLTRLKGSTGLISRRHYRGLYSDALRSEADRVYDRLVGKGKSHLSADDIDRQIRALRRFSRNIAAYADKVIAHTDQSAPTVVPQFRESGRVIRYLELLVQRYYQLFHGVHWDPHTTLPPDWEAPFWTVWIPSSSRHTSALEDRNPLMGQFRFSPLKILNKG